LDDPVMRLIARTGYEWPAAAISAGSDADVEYSEMQLTHLASLLSPITRLLGR